jgi:hypothetical protein
MRTRLQRLKERETQKLVGVIFGGKLLGIAGTLGIVKAFSWYFDTAAGAQTAPIVHKANDLINPVNTIWVLVTAFLVFFMQAGFMALEAGFARSRETVNIMLECVVDTCLAGLLFWAFGFAFMFGTGNGFIGHEFFMLHGAPATYGSTASPSWRSGCSSSPSSTRAPRSPRAPWSAAPASWATSSTPSACPASSTRSSATGSGVRVAGSAT